MTTKLPTPAPKFNSKPKPSPPPPPKKYPACIRLVKEQLVSLGFSLFEHLKNREVAFILYHENSVRCEIPIQILEKHPEIEEKVNAVLAYYIYRITRFVGRHDYTIDLNGELVK